MAMLKLARAIFGNPRSADERAHEQLIEAAIDKVVLGTDPRLVAVSGYRKKLRDPVERAIKYVRGLTQNFKEPLEVNRRTFASNADTHAFFSSIGQIQEVFSLSQPLREFLAKPDNILLKYVYAGLAMRNEEKRVFVSQLVGDQVQHDVARTAVNFTGHRVVIPSASREALHQEFIERAFFTLVECALRQLTAVRKHHQELGRERSALRARLRAVKSRALGMGPLASGVQPSEDSLPGIEEQLLSTERELQGTAAGSGTLESHLDRVVKVLGQPHEHLRLTWVSSRVTSMGLLAGADSREAADDVDYMEIEIVGQDSFVGRLVRYPCDEMLPLERFRPVL
jgi:hypothetical protein